MRHCTTLPHRTAPINCLPVAAGPTAAGAAAAEAAKAAAPVVIIATAAASSAAAQQVGEDEEDPAGVAGAHQQDQHQQDHSAAHQHLPQAQLHRLADLAVVVHLGNLQGDAGVGGDDLPDPRDAARNRQVVVASLHGRHHGAADVAYLGVVQDAFEAVAHLDAALGGAHDEQHQDAAIGALGADLPLLFESGGELFYRLRAAVVPLDGLDGDDGDLGVRLPIDLEAEIVDAVDGLRRQNAGEVVDVAGRGGQLGHLLGARARERQQQQQRHDKFGYPIHYKVFYAPPTGLASGPLRRRAPPDYKRKRPERRLPLQRSAA